VPFNFEGSRDEGSKSAWDDVVAAYPRPWRPANGDGSGAPWCCLCLRAEGDTEDEREFGAGAEGGDGGDGGSLDVGRTSQCAGGLHLFCWRCAEVCGGAALLCTDGRCPLCRLAARAGGFDKLVTASRPLRVPHPLEDWAAGFYTPPFLRST